MKHLYLFAAACIMASTATAATPTLTKVDNLTPVTRAEIKTDRIHGTAPSKAVNTMKVASRADEELTWTSIGTAMFTDDVVCSLYGFTPITYGVEMEECSEVPGLYRLIEPYRDNPYNAVLPQYGVEAIYDDSSEHYMIIHAENPDAVYIEDFSTGLDWSYGIMDIFSDVPNFLEQGHSLDVIAASGFCGSLNGGVITFPANKIYVSDEDGEYYANTNGEFKIQLPGAKDYTVSISAPTCGDDNVIPITVSFGADVTKALFAIVPGEYPFSSECYQIVPHMGYDFPTESGTYPISLDGFEKGRYTFYLVVVDEDGNYCSGDGTFFYSIPDEDADWKSIGFGTYGEDFVGSIYKLGPKEFEVEIEENINTPGFYRLVNPYAANGNWPGAANADYHQSDSHNHHIYIHAEDPTRVYIEEAPIGVDFGYGDMIISSNAHWYLTNSDEIDADILEAYGMFGSLDTDGNITFPKNTLRFAETNEGKGAWYPANKNGKFMVKLPSEYVSGIKSSINNENGEAVYYNLQGVRVANPTNGIFIMKSGNTVTKVIR